MVLVDNEKWTNRNYIAFGTRQKAKLFFMHVSKYPCRQQYLEGKESIDHVNIRIPK